jgi:cell wall-associated NlpC family hydrolase
MCSTVVADILEHPGGPRVSQLVFGERFLTLEVNNGFAYGSTLRDGYCGYMAAEFLVEPVKPTHWVSTPATHLYPDANMKLMTVGELFFGSEILVENTKGSWAYVAGGYCIPGAHLLPLTTRFSDPVGVAEQYLGAPYLWGGNSRNGIDCSGLIQSAWQACGLRCPRDSDMQEAEIGTAIAPESPNQRGDLVFWKGHVGIMTNDADLLHANAHHMSVVCEPLGAAVERIEKAGSGPITSVKRV